MQSPQPQAPVPDPFVVRVDTYENHLGQRLFDRVVVSGTPPPGYCRFVGQGQINTSHPAVGPIHHPFSFGIEADTLERAYEMFEANAQAEARTVLARIGEQIRRQMTAVQPVSEKALGLLDSAGNPLKTR